MGLRCLLGHDFGEIEVEREREEDGDEMVVTIREVQTCSRCGTERVVSENKEVTAIRSPEDIGVDESGADSGSDAESAADAEATAGADAADAAGTDTGVAGDHPRADTAAFEPPEDADEDDGVILGEAESSDRQPGEWPDADQPQASRDATETPDTEAPDPAARAAATDTADAAETGGDAADTGDTAEPADADTAGTPDEGGDEDAEFIDAEADNAPGADDDTEAGSEGETVTAEGAASPAHTDDGTDSPTAWPDHGGEDEGFDAEPGGSEDVSFGGNGLTPDVDTDEPADDAEYVEADAPGVGGAGEGEAGAGPNAGGDREALDTGSGITREERASVELSESAERTGEFYCPNCGLTRPASGSSMRAGDICPECRKGYITERDA